MDNYFLKRIVTEWANGAAKAEKETGLELSTMGWAVEFGSLKYGAQLYCSYYNVYSGTFSTLEGVWNWYEVERANRLSED